MVLKLRLKQINSSSLGWLPKEEFNQIWQPIKKKRKSIFIEFQ